MQMLRTYGYITDGQSCILLAICTFGYVYFCWTCLSSLEGICCVIERGGRGQGSLVQVNNRFCNHQERKAWCFCELRRLLPPVIKALEIALVQKVRL